MSLLLSGSSRGAAFLRAALAGQPSLNSSSNAALPPPSAVPAAAIATSTTGSVVAVSASAYRSSTAAIGGSLHSTNASQLSSRVASGHLQQQQQTRAGTRPTTVTGSTSVSAAAAGASATPARRRRGRSSGSATAYTTAASAAAAATTTRANPSPAPTGASSSPQQRQQQQRHQQSLQCKPHHQGQPQNQIKSSFQNGRPSIHKQGPLSPKQQQLLLLQQRRGSLHSRSSNSTENSSRSSESGKQSDSGSATEEESCVTLRLVLPCAACGESGGGGAANNSVLSDLGTTGDARSRNGERLSAADRSLGTTASSVVVVCSECRKAFHQSCHTPRIPQVFVDDSNRPWRCRMCVPQGSVRKSAKNFRAITRALYQTSLPYSPSKLGWDLEHTQNTNNRYCYCGKSGIWKEKMLQCRACLQWFHQDCVRCLEWPLLRGDLFYNFRCSVCTRGPEYLRRLRLSWVDVTDLTMYQLHLTQPGKDYFQTRSEIFPYLDSIWSLLQVPHELDLCSTEERHSHVLYCLRHVRQRFRPIALATPGGGHGGPAFALLDPKRLPSLSAQHWQAIKQSLIFSQTAGAERHLSNGAVHRVNGTAGSRSEASSPILRPRSCSLASEQQDAYDDALSVSSSLTVSSDHSVTSIHSSIVVASFSSSSSSATSIASGANFAHIFDSLQRDQNQDYDARSDCSFLGQLQQPLQQQQLQQQENLQAHIHSNLDAPLVLQQQCNAETKETGPASKDAPVISETEILQPKTTVEAASLKDGFVSSQSPKPELAIVEHLKYNDDLDRETDSKTCEPDFGANAVSREENATSLKGSVNDAEDEDNNSSDEPIRNKLRPRTAVQEQKKRKRREKRKNSKNEGGALGDDNLFPGESINVVTASLSFIPIPSSFEGADNPFHEDPIGTVQQSGHPRLFLGSQIDYNFPRALVRKRKLQPRDLVITKDGKVRCKRLRRRHSAKAVVAAQLLGSSAAAASHSECSSSNSASVPQVSLDVSTPVENCAHRHGLRADLCRAVNSVEEISSSKKAGFKSAGLLTSENGSSKTKTLREEFKAVEALGLSSANYTGSVFGADVHFFNRSSTSNILPLSHFPSSRLNAHAVAPLPQQNQDQTTLALNASNDTEGTCGMTQQLSRANNHDLIRVAFGQAVLAARIAADGSAQILLKK